MRNPEILHFQATERCNLACPGCYLPERTGKGAGVSEIGSRVFGPLAASGVRLATVTGGEPLLHQQIVEICREACRVFDSVQVVTNGLLLDLDMFARLREAGVSSIKVSLDGACAATHDLLRGKKGAFDETVGRLKAILALPEALRSGVELGSIATVHAANVREMCAIASLSRELGLDHHLAQPFHPFGMVYPPGDAAEECPHASPAFLEALSSQIDGLKAVKAQSRDFIDNSLEMLDKFVEFHTSPRGPRQICGANRFVFVNSMLEVRGCLFCRPLANLGRLSPEAVFSGEAWRGFQKFRRTCRKCLMGCQFMGVAQRLSAQGFTMVQSGDFRRAERLFAASLERERTVDSVQGLGVAVWGQGRLGEAEPLFREVVQERPAHPFAGGDLCEVLRTSGRMDEALEAGADAVTKAPTSAHAHSQYGLTLVAGSRVEQGMDHLLQASRLNPGGAWIRFNLGMALLSLGRAEHALECFREAVRLDPGVPWFHYRLGLTLNGRGQAEEALGEMRQAVKLAPDAAKPHLELGRMLLANGRKKDAAVHLRRARDIDPNLVAKEFPEGIADAF
jgi:MoaA/NifB/PqqE/SkfB family radical SAM enzyme/Tfp pilus assembly protein PilF